MVLAHTPKKPSSNDSEPPNPKKSEVETVSAAGKENAARNTKPWKQPSRSLNLSAKPKEIKVNDKGALLVYSPGSFTRFMNDCFVRKDRLTL